jgi:hypothetical protein
LTRRSQPDSRPTHPHDNTRGGGLGETSWYAAGHTLQQPDHPFTKASQRPVVPGQVTRFDISLLANFTEIPAGRRLLD